MVELVEYILVFGVTVSLSVFSVVILTGSSPLIGQSQTKAELDEIAGAASLAALRGNTTLVIPLAGTSVECSQGIVSISSGSSSFSSPIGYPCDFRLDGMNCLCTLSFTRSGNGVDVKVVS